MIINESGKIQLVNNQTEKLFEYNRNELIGKKVEMLIPERYKHNHPKHRTKFFGDPKVRGMGAGLELFAVKKSGEEFPVDISLSPVDTDEGKWVSAAIRDITDLKIHLSQREQMKNKDMFLGIASHELKTPLTSLRAYVSLIEDRINEIPDETLKMYTSRLNKNIGNIEGLINDLLDVSRIQNEKLQFRMERNWFDEVIHSSVESTQFETLKHHLVIQENEKISSIFDFQRMEQVMTNLLFKAIKYFPKGGKILISSRKVNNNIHVSVKDYGIGIPPENNEKIFERFFRVNEKSFKFKGLGIGLFITKEIIQRHDGRIWVESTGFEGEGTTFNFLAPIK